MSFKQCLTSYLKDVDPSLLSLHLLRGNPRPMLSRTQGARYLQGVNEPHQGNGLELDRQPAGQAGLRRFHQIRCRRLLPGDKAARGACCLLSNHPTGLYISSLCLCARGAPGSDKLNYAFFAPRYILPSTVFPETACHDMVLGAQRKRLAVRGIPLG